jgi:hypothetical protein
MEDLPDANFNVRIWKGKSADILWISNNDSLINDRYPRTLLNTSRWFAPRPILPVPNDQGFSSNPNVRAGSLAV